MSEWFCNTKCKISHGGAGPWSDENKEFFFNIKYTHYKCVGFQKGEPKLRGKANWGYTEIEKLFNDYFFTTIDEGQHNLIAYEKGPSKCCLIKDKWKCVNQK